MLKRLQPNSAVLPPATVENVLVRTTSLEHVLHNFVDVEQDLILDVPQDRRQGAADAVELLCSQTVVLSYHERAQLQMFPVPRSVHAPHRHSPHCRLHQLGWLSLMLFLPASSGLLTTDSISSENCSTAELMLALDTPSNSPAGEAFFCLRSTHSWQCFGCDSQLRSFTRRRICRRKRENPGL